MKTNDVSLADHIGGRLRALRLAHGWRLKDVAVYVGVSPMFMSLVERGLSSMSVETLWKLSQAFGVRVDYWFRGYEGE